MTRKRKSIAAAVTVLLLFLLLAIRSYVVNKNIDNLAAPELIETLKYTEAKASLHARVAGALRALESHAAIGPKTTSKRVRNGKIDLEMVSGCLYYSRKPARDGRGSVRMGNVG